MSDKDTKEEHAVELLYSECETQIDRIISSVNDEMKGSYCATLCIAALSTFATFADEESLRAALDGLKELIESIEQATSKEGS